MDTPSPAAPQPDDAPLRDTVLTAIEDGDVRMRPRWHFALVAALAASGTVVATLAVLYLCSFAVFVLQRSGAWDAPSLGARGLYAFLLSAPWLVILAALAFVVALEMLVRRYAFAYRRPLLVTLAILVLLMLLGSLVVARTTLHDGLYRRAAEARLPFAGPLYRVYDERRLPLVHPGVVEAPSTEGFILVEHRGDKVRVTLEPKLVKKLPALPASGDMVIVFGELQDGTISAFGIRPLVLERMRRADVPARAWQEVPR
jgi:hypothetical protein